MLALACAAKPDVGQSGSVSGGTSGGAEPDVEVESSDGGVTTSNTDSDGTATTGDEGSTSALATDSDSEAGTETEGAECAPYSSHLYDGFENYKPEDSLSGNNPFDAAGRTRATDTVVHTGQGAARMEIRPEDGGGFGQWGGIVPLPDVGAGGSVWVRLWVQWPSDFEFSAAPWMKFIRLHNRNIEGSNAGYNDLYVDNADGKQSVLRVIKEIHDVWEVYDGPPLPRDVWERYEMQIVVDDVPVDDGGQARFRVWRGDELIFDRTDVPTISAVGGVIDGLYLFTYWNNEAPPNNVMYIDELAIAIDEPPPNFDEQGNAYFGDWVPCRTR